MKLLYNTSTQQLQPYPRDDDEAVIGLDPVYEVFDVIQGSPPDPVPDGFSLRTTQAVNVEAKTVTRGFELVAISEPPVVVNFRSLAFTLQSLGLYEQVKAAALSSIEGEIWWNTAQSTTVAREHPFVASLGESLGQTPDQLDAIFAAALKLPRD